MAQTLDLPASVRPLLPLFTVVKGVWLVGGAVRSLLLGQEAVDLDFAVAGGGRRLAKRVADALGGAYYDLDRERDAGRVVLQSEVGRLTRLDFSRLRGEDILEDLRGRDFTVNALAISLEESPQLLDPTGGLGDLRNRVLRACSAGALAQDPVRALRAVRFAIQLDFRMERATVSQIVAAADKLPQVAGERTRDEFMNILDLPYPGKALRLLDRLSLLEAVLPEMADLRDLRQPPPHEYLALEHTLAVSDRLAEILDLPTAVARGESAGDLTKAHMASQIGRFRGEWMRYLRQQPTSGRNLRQLLFFSALMHDAGKPACRSEEGDGRIRFIGHEQVGAELAASRAGALRLSNSEVKILKTIILNHMWPGALQSSGGATPRATYRFWRQNGSDGISVILLSLADLLGMRPLPPEETAWSSRLEVARTLLLGHLEMLPSLLNGPPLLRGGDLMAALGQPPGPLIGRLLEYVREAQAAGEVKTRDEALALVKQAVADRGTDPSVWDRTSTLMDTGP